MPKRNIEDVVHRLVKALVDAEGPMSTRQVAKRSGVDWKAAQKYLGLLNELSNAGVLIESRRGRSKMWLLRKRREDARRLKKVEALGEIARRRWDRDIKTGRLVETEYGWELKIDA